MTKEKGASSKKDEKHGGGGEKPEKPVKPKMDTWILWLPVVAGFMYLMYLSNQVEKNSEITIAEFLSTHLANRQV